MPGAGLQNITNLAKNEVTALTKSDMVIVCGGSNDVNRNESQAGLNSLRNFVNLRTNTKVLILPLPQRHDLTYDSCVNKEIQSFNRKLHKIMKNKEMVKILDYGIRREAFTRHGQHLSSKGKSKLAQLIAQYLTRSSLNNITNSIPMKWKTSTSNFILTGSEA
jgi:lysophospholipase L1-like esterase